jgi:hypothetical protein
MSEGGGGKIFVGVLMLLVGLGFATAALADFYMLVKVIPLLRKSFILITNSSGLGNYFYI